MFYILLYLAKTFIHMTHCEDREREWVRDGGRGKETEKKERKKLVNHKLKILIKQITALEQCWRLQALVVLLSCLGVTIR